MNLPVKFVALIGAENSLLFLQAYDGSDEKSLRYHFLANMALDYVASQLAYSERAKDYALLLVHDGIAVFGSLSNTNIKIIVGTEAHDYSRYPMRAIMHSIQLAYISYVCNAFYDPRSTNSMITSKKFKKSIVSSLEKLAGRDASSAATQEVAA